MPTDLIRPSQSGVISTGVVLIACWSQHLATGEKTRSVSVELTGIEPNSATTGGGQEEIDEETAQILADVETMAILGKADEDYRAGRAVEGATLRKRSSKS